MKKLCSLGVLAAFHVALASETFGGLGLAIYPSEQGAEVAHVVQGASAHLAGIEVGDFLVAANDVSLAGKSLDFDMETLRGNPGELVELTVLRNSDTLRISVLRETLVSKSPVEDARSGVVFKSATEESLRFLDAVELPDLNANVYAKASESPIPNPDFRSGSGRLALSAFDRRSILFELERSGPVTLEIFSAHGEKVESIRTDGLAGTNLLDWNGSGLSSGSYLVQVSQGRKSLSCTGVLR